MRRLILFFTVIGLLLSLNSLCFAAEEPLTVTDTKAGNNQTVYLAVNLNESAVANSIGVKCEYDETLLTALPDLCTWGTTGVVSAFKADNIGAWASDSAKDLQGKICILAFQVKDGVAFDQTDVACTVVLKNGSEQVGSYTAKGTILCQCTHNYSDFTSAGKLGHTRICSLCGGKNTQDHKWDDGTQAPGQQGTTIVTKTCLVCLEQTKIELPAGYGPSTEPENGNSNVPTQNTGNQSTPDHNDQHDHNDPHESQVSGKPNPPSQPDHTHLDTEKDPVDNHTHASDDTSNTTEHSHASDNERNPNLFWIILGVLALAVVGYEVFSKRKR